MSCSGNLYIISSPSGGGKTTLVNSLLQELTKIQVSVSHTTRARRLEEKDGVNYNFVSVEQFQKMIAQGKFLEYAEVFGNYYGTSQEWVGDALAKGMDVILEIDWQGAQQIRQRIKETVSIFILPPSLSELRERLTKRKSEDVPTITKRLAQAQVEVSHYNEYDYIVINDDFAKALEGLVAIVKAKRLQLSAKTTKIANEIINNF